MAVGQKDYDTTITTEMKQLYFFVVHCILMELGARFGERCKLVYAAETTLSANLPIEKHPK